MVASDRKSCHWASHERSPAAMGPSGNGIKLKGCYLSIIFRFSLNCLISPVLSLSEDGTAKRPECRGAAGDSHSK